jgi:hypothetical membrane protein
MKVSREVVILGVLLVCALHPQHAQARGPSTPEERAKVVELARALEREPLAENAAVSRQWLREWIADVPDIRFKVCADLLGHGLGHNYPYSHEVNLQVLFSGAALALEDQGKARHDAAVYTAGVEGALRVYEALVKSKPDAKSAFLDDLVAKRDQGQLFNYVGKLAGEKCKTSNILLLAAPAGGGVGFILALLIAWWFGKGHDDRVVRASATVAKTFELIVLICAAYYVTVAVILHVLMPEYDPRYRFMSEYAWGAYGSLMTTTFFVLGLAIVTVALGIRKVYQSSRSARIGFGLLLVGALGICLAGVFREFIPHAAAGAVGLPSILLAALLLSWSFRQSLAWRSIHPATLLVALGMLATFLSIIFDVGMPGLQQRAFLFLVLLWLLVVAHRIGRVTRGIASE